jgi:beta-lactamase class A
MLRRAATVPTTFLLSLACACAASARDDATLEARLRPLIDAHKGKVAVAVKHLGTGETYTFHATDVMPTASLIKFPIMIEAYRQAEAKTVDFATPIVVTEEDKVPGSGVLTEHFSAGTRINLLDAVHLMIVFSDNTATNLVLDQIGIPATAATMEAMGFPETKVHSKVYKRSTTAFPERSEKYGLGSTTAADMLALCEKLHKKELVSPAASEAMYNHMLACDDKDKFPRFLPPGTKVAFKTGSVNASRTAAGIIQTPAGPVALCVLTSENEDQSWIPDNAGDRLCAEVAREVHRHFGTAPSDAK